MADFVFRSHKKEFEGRLKSAMQIGLEAVGADGERNAKQEITKLVYDTPESPNYVRTGRLRNSITWATKTHEGYGFQYSDNKGNTYKDSVGTGVKEGEALIGTNVEYAAYVEFGTHGKSARPFLLNACQNYVENYKSILEQALATLSD